VSADIAVLTRLLEERGLRVERVKLVYRGKWCDGWRITKPEFPQWAGLETVDDPPTDPLGVGPAHSLLDAASVALSELHDNNMLGRAD
jgi:hypothetical protein